MRKQPSNHPRYSAVCARCGVSFTRKQGKPPKYCSRDCQTAAWRENVQRSASAKGNAEPRIDSEPRARIPGPPPRPRSSDGWRSEMLRSSSLSLIKWMTIKRWAERGEYWRELADSVRRPSSRCLVATGPCPARPGGPWCATSHQERGLGGSPRNDASPPRSAHPVAVSRRIEGCRQGSCWSGRMERSRLDLLAFLARHDIPVGRSSTSADASSPRSAGLRCGVRLRRAQIDAIDDGRGLRFAVR